MMPRGWALGGWWWMSPTLRVPGGVANPGGNEKHYQWMGADSTNTAGMGGNNRAGAHAMSGLDQGTGNFSTADGSVSQGDNASWTAALVLAGKAKGGNTEYPRRGSVSRHLH
jgi:hypothetical protein